MTLSDQESSVSSHNETIQSLHLDHLQLGSFRLLWEGKEGFTWLYDVQ